MRRQFRPSSDRGSSSWGERSISKRNLAAYVLFGLASAPLSIMLKCYFEVFFLVEVAGEEPGAAGGVLLCCYLLYACSVPLFCYLIVTMQLRRQSVRFWMVVSGPVMVLAGVALFMVPGGTEPRRAPAGTDDLDTVLYLLVYLLFGVAAAVAEVTSGMSLFFMTDCNADRRRAIRGRLYAEVCAGVVVSATFAAMFAMTNDHGLRQRACSIPEDQIEQVQKNIEKFRSSSQILSSRLRFEEILHSFGLERRAADPRAGRRTRLRRDKLAGMVASSDRLENFIQARKFMPPEYLDTLRVVFFRSALLVGLFALAALLVSATVLSQTSRVREGMRRSGGGDGLFSGSYAFFWRTFNMPFQFEPFRRLVGVCVFSTFGTKIVRMLLLIYCKEQLAWHNTYLYFVVLLEVLVVLFTALWEWLCRKMHLKDCFTVGLCVLAASMIAMASYGSRVPHWVSVATLMPVAAGYSNVHMLPYKLLRVVVSDFNFGQSHIRRNDGLFFAVFTCVCTIVDGAAAATTLFVMSGFDHVPAVCEQSLESKIGLRLLVGPLPVVLLLVAVSICRFFSVNHCRRGKQEADKLVRAHRLIAQDYLAMKAAIVLSHPPQPQPPPTSPHSFPDSTKVTFAKE